MLGLRREMPESEILRNPLEPMKGAIERLLRRQTSPRRPPGHHRAVKEPTNAEVTEPELIMAGRPI